jgi:PAS domain S-box-containing protein
MAVDIRTLILILGISHLMQVLVFLYQYKANRNIPGPGWWLMWSAAEAIAFVLILLRNIPALLPIAIIFQNIILLAGTLFIYIGILRFFDKKINLKFILLFFISFIIIHLSLFIVHDNITLRSVNISAFLSVVSFLTAFTIYKNKTRSILLTANFNAALFVLHGSIFAYRSIMIILGIQVADVFSPTFFNFLPYFDALIVSLLWTFGFIMMLNQRLNSEISEAKAHFELIFNTSPDAAVISRLSDGLFVDCNEGFTKITGFSKKDVASNSSLEINLWKNPSDRLELVRQIKENGFCENFESYFQGKNGNVFIGLMSAKTLMINNEPHIISVTRNITDRKLAEEEIRFKNEELKKLNAEKDKFFSIIAHDLRSPFNGFIGLTDILVKQSHTLALSDIKQISNAMRTSALNLYSLLENLLEWSLIEQGLIPFKPAMVQLQFIITESLKISVESARIKEIKISNDIPENLSVFVDINIIMTVIRNLISNAVKFTPKGGKIILSARSVGDDMVEIAIKDTGIGMAPLLKENLFKLDYNTNRKGTEGEPSTGLGLILCHDFIEKHGGKLWVDSEPGLGSVFYFTIPSHPTNVSGLN